MSISPGSSLGQYEIVGALGKGGMGEVWRARDTKLERDVAIKTLPASFADDTDRLARFEREAKLLASLNHANIAAIHGLDEHEGTRYLAMELVEGETLEEKLKAGALPVEEALQIALQVAHALEAAHANGIVHRDLKPANIMITGHDQVKVLDFGLAKAFSGNPTEASPAHSPALSVAMTQAGLILGTAGYMSPEQASGQATDQRADIWAFGVVLYEMLTGLPLFSGESVPHVLAAVLQTEPDWGRLPKNLHPRLRQVLERCLRKKVRNRYYSIADVRVDIEEILADPAGLTAPPHGAAPARSSRLGIAATITLAVVAAASAAFLTWSFQPEPARAITRFSIDLEGPLPAFSPIALSPDGRRIVYAVNEQLYSRRLDQPQATLIPGTEGGQDPFFSPDGAEIAFTTANALKAVGFAGDAPRVIASLERVGLTGTWDASGRIFLGQGGPYDLLTVPAVGGVPQTFAERSDYRDLDYPDVLPGGEWVLYTANRIDGDWSGSDIVAQSIATGERKVVLEGGHFARYVESGHLLFARDATLYAVAFDPEKLEPIGSIVPVVQNVWTDETSGHAKYAMASNGTLIYASGRASNAAGTMTLVRSDREGNLSPLSAETRNYEHPRVSPDGTRVAVEVTDATGGVHLWILTLATGRAVQLTFEGSANRGAVWTPDSREILYVSDAGDARAVYRRAADGTGPASRVLEGSARLRPTDVTADNELVYEDEGVGTGLDIFTFPLDENGPATPYLATPDEERMGRVSPDGHWMAYVSGTGPDSRIFIRAYPDAEGAQRAVPEMGGVAPAWSPTGDEIYFLIAGSTSLGALATVGIESTPTTVVPGIPRVLSGFVNSGFQAVDWPFLAIFDVMPDGDGVVGAYYTGLLTPDAAVTERPQINVVLNWDSELERLVPVD
jgi:serine/threonine protein kinase/Tol biopolymer transport system component